MKIIKKLLSVIAILAVALSLFIIPSYAITETCPHGNRTFNDHYITGGVGQYGNYRRYYWISPGVDNTYVSAIQSAVNSWVYTSSSPGVTTSISLRQTNTKSSSNFDYYNTSLSGDTTGYTEFWYYSNQITDPSTANWGYVKILIDCSKTSSNNGTVKQGLAGHELGHAMGLSHQPNLPDGGSIMYNYDNRRGTSAPTRTDCNTINHIYG